MIVEMTRWCEYVIQAASVTRNPWFLHSRNWRACCAPKIHFLDSFSSSPCRGSTNDLIRQMLHTGDVSLDQNSPRYIPVMHPEHFRAPELPARAIKGEVNIVERL